MEANPRRLNTALGKNTTGSRVLRLEPDEISSSCFVAPDARLQPYVSSYYFTAIESRDGAPVADMLNPEWAVFRFCWKGQFTGGFQGEPIQVVPPIHFSGPTTRAISFEAQRAWMGGVGFLPLGWHRFMTGSAHDWANRFCLVEDIDCHLDYPAIWEALQELTDDPVAMAQLLDHHLIAVLDREPEHTEMEARITAVHAALVDPETENVASIADRLEITSQTLLRISQRVFGFAPKVLLRRQRFVRTLETIMRNPGQNWVDALDTQYYDLSHFHRDFHAFFGLTPQQYRQMPHPVIAAAVMARIRALGAPLLALHTPGDDAQSAAAE